MNKVLIIAGPTASGKSELAIEIAKKYDGEIISCDSMQIYKYLDIGTAKIKDEEKQNIKHYMLDVVMPGEEYSVWEYSVAAKKLIENISSRGKLPIVAGGTGLYIESVIYPLNFSVNKDDDVRARLQRELEESGAEKLHDRLKSIDPQDAEKIHPNNTKRLIRALEIIELSGGVKNKEELKTPQYDVCLISLEIPRDELYGRIDKRVERMFASGLEHEVRDLLDKGLVTKDSQSMQAIGYKEFFPYFEGKRTLVEVKEEIKQNTRRYAKRQLSWLRRYKFAHCLKPSDKNTADNIVKEFLRG